MGNCSTEAYNIPIIHSKNRIDIQKVIVLGALSAIRNDLYYSNTKMVLSVCAWRVYSPVSYAVRSISKEMV